MGRRCTRSKGGWLTRGSLSSVTMFFLTVIACVVAADFLTGLVHWWEDTYGLPTWPLIGKAVIEPNIEHHKSPSVMASMGNLVSRNLQPALLAIASCVAFHFFGVASWPVILTSILAACGNEIHCWTHRKHTSRIVRLLQDMALVITPQQHAKHHKPPYNTHFCTITNLVNPVLELLRFWSVLELLIAHLTGIKPKRMTKERGGV